MAITINILTLVLSYKLDNDFTFMPTAYIRVNVVLQPYSVFISDQRHDMQSRSASYSNTKRLSSGVAA